MPAAFGFIRSNREADARTRLLLRPLSFTGSSSILQEHPGTGMRHLRHSPKRDHALACHQCTYRSIPWATLDNGLWRAPLAFRPWFPGAPAILAPRPTRYDRVSRIHGRDPSRDPLDSY